MHPLDGAYIRLDRAEEHLTQLKTLIEIFVDGEYDLAREKEKLDSERAKPAFRLRTGDSQIPLKIPVLVGEIAYNLRATLDYLVYELAILDSGSTQNGTQFPICDAPDAFRRRRKTFLNGINDTHAAAIETLQPYGAGSWKHPFRLLRTISNPDKHRHLVIHKQQGSGWGAGSEDPAYLAKYPTDVKGIIVHTEVEEPGRPTVYMRLHYTIFVAFDSGLSVIDTLEEIKTKVDQTLGDFKPGF